MANSERFYYFSRIGELFRRAGDVRLQATFASGVATKDTTAGLSDPDIAIVKDSTGDYDVTGLPVGKQLHVVGCYLDPGADSPSTTAGTRCAPRSFSASAKSGKVVFTRADTGALADPPDGSRLFLTLRAEMG